MRKRIEEGTVAEWSKIFPAVYGGVRLEANNLRLEGKENFSLQDQKKAWMENRELGRPLKADLELYDDATGDKLDERPAITLMRVPFYTDRGTFVYNGNNYTCLHGTSKVWTENGRKTIASLVRENFSGRVWSWNFDKNRLELRRVINWFKLEGKAGVMRTAVRHGMTPSLTDGQRSNYTLRCTSDHGIFESSGSKLPAQAASRVAVLREDLSESQLQMVLGTMLGDGTIQPPNIYRVTQCDAQKDYAQLKLSMLEAFVKKGSALKKGHGKSPLSGRKLTHWTFHTNSSVAFQELRVLIYPDGIRSLATDWHLLCDERALAFWFCDDGSSRYNRIRGKMTGYPSVSLHTQNFTREDVVKLQEWLLSKWDLRSNIVHVGPPKGMAYNPDLNWQLDLHGKSAWDFLELVAPFVPEGFRYKILDKPVSVTCKKCKKTELFGKRKVCDPCYRQEILGNKGTLSKSIRYLFGDSKTARAWAEGYGKDPQDFSSYTRWARCQKLQGKQLPALLKDTQSRFSLMDLETSFLPNDPGRLGKENTVYDIEVEGNHNFFANGFLVSNCSNQSRMIPGAYARRQANGLLESQFNVRSGTGRAFRVALEPATGQLRMRIKGGDMHLYSMLKAIGVSDEELEESWGKEVLDLNRQKVDTRVLDRAYKKFVPPYSQIATSEQEKSGLILEALEKSQISKNIVARTLGAYWPSSRIKSSGDAFRDILFGLLPKQAAAMPARAGFDLREAFGDTDDEGDEYQPVGVAGLLAASKKLLAINRGLDEPDERQGLAFSKIYTMDKLMRERIRLDEGKLRRGLLRMVASRRNLSPVHHRVFDPYYREMITKNPMTSPIEETNPFQLITQQRRVTQMGPGGIGSTDAISSEMQAVQPSEYGFYSPYEVPESDKAGVEVRLTAGTRIGRDGRLRQRFRNLQTGALEWKSPADLLDSAMKIPD